MKIAGTFYGIDGFASKTHPHYSLFDNLAKYGNLPGQLLAVGALLLWLYTFYKPSWQSMRKAALVVALVGFLGACVGIHLVLKEVYGRPRPREVVEFGGPARFTPIYAPTWHVPNDNYKSFPSGHVAMGMLFVTLGLVGWKERSYSAAIFGLIFGLGFSVLLGYSRMAVGAHFLSDVLSSFVLMWTLSVVLVMFFYPGDVKAKAGKRRAR